MDGTSSAQASIQRIWRRWFFIVWSEGREGKKRRRAGWVSAGLRERIQSTRASCRTGREPGRESAYPTHPLLQICEREGALLGPEQRRVGVPVRLGDPRRERAGLEPRVLLLLRHRFLPQRISPTTLPRLRGQPTKLSTSSTVLCPSTIAHPIQSCCRDRDILLTGPAVTVCSSVAPGGRGLITEEGPMWTVTLLWAAPERQRAATRCSSGRPY
ncbi:hypothetical protein DFJ74DRAFT_121792 [Hyaloraphidium curvatum]|nr:hypothetical protein DFJ74DRAFT_121792 [Hyaloraphidium curvatum]